ncbi:hypothetical protein [Micromonospora sp. NPDC050495]|uniref:hypothetical protein n=1 Tax=Micromonospora sp. NPDC050495 TaxID=3154936 RepID=UPI0033D13F65
MDIACGSTAATADPTHGPLVRIAADTEHIGSAATADTAADLVHLVAVGTDLAEELVEVGGGVSDVPVAVYAHDHGSASNQISDKTTERLWATMRRAADAVGVTPAGEPTRLVRPDGMEVRGARTFCRGPELHVIVGTSWYRTDLGLLGQR